MTSNPTTALWFACQKPRDAAADAPGALFAFDVTDIPEYATAYLAPTWGDLSDPLGWCLTGALAESAQRNGPSCFVRAFRMLECECKKVRFSLGLSRRFLQSQVCLHLGWHTAAHQVNRHWPTSSILEFDREAGRDSCLSSLS